MATLYEISENIRQVIEQGFSVDEETGEILFDETDLVELEIAKEEKMEGVMLTIKNLRAEADALKAEKQALEKRQKQKNKKAEWLEKYLANIMKLFKQDKFESPKGVATFATRRQVIINDKAEIPSDFMRATKYEPDKVAIKAAITNGLYVPGATYEVPEGKINIK